MMRFIRFSCVAVLLLATLRTAAQEVPTPPDTSQPPQTQQPVKPPAAPPRNARITGTVLCADTRHPARGAMVMISPLPSTDAKEPQNNASQAITRVASDGTYVAEHLAAGEYSVIAMLPGYLSPMDDMTVDMKDNSPQKQREFLLKYGTVVVGAQETGRFDLSLQRGGAVSGRVLYPDGSPASQVMIDVQDVNAKPLLAQSPEDTINAGAFMRAILMHQSSGTDDQGHYRISGLRPGTYRVAAVQASANPLTSSGADEFMAGWTGLGANPKGLHVYSGDTLHKKSAKTYELRSGDEVSGIDITIPTDAFHRIQGRLSASDGRAITTAMLTLTDAKDDTLVFHGEIARDGVFIFPAVPTGTYTLVATQAEIGTLIEGFPENVAILGNMITVTNAFADGNTSVIVKDSDVADINLGLTEVPLPHEPAKPAIQNITGPPSP